MKILAADMWSVFNAEPRGEVYQKAISNAEFRFKRFVESLLLYDEIHVPTDDFLPARMLADVLGTEGLTILLNEGVLKFVRFRGAIAYIGAGNGLSVFNLGKPGEEVAVSAAPGVAARNMLTGIAEPKEVLRLSANIARGTKEIDLGGVRDEIKRRTYNGDPAKVRKEKEYVKLLKTMPTLDKGFFRTVRLFITAGVGLLNPVAGLLAAAADTFGVPKLKESSAKFLIERLEQLNAKQSGRQ